MNAQATGRIYRYHVEKNGTVLSGATATWSHEHKAQTIVRALRVADKNRGERSKYSITPCQVAACFHGA